MLNFIEKLLINFLEYRNSLNPYLLSKSYLATHMSYKIKKLKNPNYFLVSRDMRRLKKRRNLYIYVGKIVFVKVQSWLIIILYTFKPIKLRKVIKKNKSFSTSPFTKTYLNYYLNTRLVQGNNKSTAFF
jgi:hypothetical protein